jgi:hypothetical protein
MVYGKFDQWVMKTLHATYYVYVWNIIALHFPYFAESDENVGTFEIHPYGKKNQCIRKNRSSKILGKNRS